MGMDFGTRSDGFPDDGEDSIQPKSGRTLMFDKDGNAYIKEERMEELDKLKQ